ncbi:hypothetical protein QYS49_06565 [Marivirga salinae]|uniref:Uncharacterized protein n=1 Tax=Marivirga salinarum TaxID=3059078 RepID=A0AA49GH54_9BACT|nr:hypothetical protein [Marivirga sp. BDSF4-3]WKK76910.2 hypothetical protein QYS49_06565 [Marivirga sp. BDSF4-3]
MEKESHQKKKEASNTKNKELKKEKEESTEKEPDEERNGIIPEDMDFKKFMGCGG